MSVTWPLVGRAEELEIIGQVMDRPESGGLVLAGEAGVGKTRLAHEAMDLAKARGIPTAWAAATEAGRPIPFGALIHWLPAPLPPAMSRDEVIRAAAGAVLERSGQIRPVVGVDDAHLVDDHSAVLLHHLAQAGSAFVIVTVRTGEPAPGPIVSLWKDALCERVELQSLSEGEMAELLETALGGQVDGATRHRVWEQTRGNPLFVREVILGGLEAGVLQEIDGVWRWKGSMVSFPRLWDLVGARLERLSSPEREALEVVAVSELVGVRILESLSSTETVASLERAGLLTETTDRRRVFARVTHPLYSEAVRETTPPARARLIAAQLANALAARGARRAEDTLRLATWRLESGTTQDPELLLPAAAHAQNLCDFVLAERLAQAAVDAGGGADASHLLAQALMGQGRFADTEDLLARVEREAVTDEERVRATSARAQNLVWNLDGDRPAMQVLEQAEQEISDPRLRDELSAQRAYLTAFTGHIDDAIAIGRRVLERNDLSGRTALNALFASASALPFAGKPEEGERLFNRWSAHVQEALQEGPIGPVGRPLFLHQMKLLSGHLFEASTLTREAYAEALDREAPWVRGFLACYVGAVERARGHVRTAIRWLREGTSLLRENDVLGHLAAFSGELAHSLALVGDVDEAEDLIQNAEAFRKTSRVDMYEEFFIGSARVWTMSARGRISAASSLALDESRLLESRGWRGPQAVLLHDVARLGEPAEVVERLNQLAEVCDGRLIPSLARHAAALVAHDAAGLEVISTEFEDMGADLLAAEASAEASRTYRDQGKTGSAMAAASRASALAALCEGARTPALEGIDAQLPLTRREREIATFAANGLSDKEIAETLVVSVRTVENHLHRVYAKLGVAGRQELKAILSPIEG